MATTRLKTVAGRQPCSSATTKEDIRRSMARWDYEDLKSQVPERSVPRYEPGDYVSPEDAARIFKTGATRDTDTGKLDYEGFLSPLVLKRYAEYMHQHRVMKDGAMRASDNWQRGIPLDE